MKNKNIIYIIGVFVIGIILTILYIFKYDKLDSTILNKNWYRYNYTNGYYDVFNIDEYKISYYRPSNDNFTNEYDSCSKYRFNKKSKSLILDCNKQIIIKKIEKNIITLLIDNEENTFFSNIDDSLNYEFNKFYGMSKSEYKKSKTQVLDLIKISNSNLLNIVKEKEYSKIIFIGNKCTSVDCFIAYDTFEKWVTVSTNTYYVNSDELDDSTINSLNNINKSFLNDSNFYNDSYPKVIITNGGKIIDSYLVNCRGFDCTSFYNK